MYVKEGTCTRHNVVMAVIQPFSPVSNLCVLRIILELGYYVTSCYGDCIGLIQKLMADEHDEQDEQDPNHREKNKHDAVQF
jgi:hypothetical protein